MAYLKSSVHRSVAPPTLKVAPHVKVRQIMAITSTTLELAAFALPHFTRSQHQNPIYPINLFSHITPHQRDVLSV
ncbi:10535_t:CDS:2 [Scutellospora calospora]|uniref:10535_t:CDS:1 n=1 Tax=Scutellospora calospora TaxID=85575 RepID=A0ACA9JV17_9GLOM|nr:10535_t:CDS:2 [Scutellospora calospora]